MTKNAKLAVATTAGRGSSHGCHTDFSFHFLDRAGPLTHESIFK